VQRCWRQHKCSNNNICRHQVSHVQAHELHFVMCIVFDNDNTCYVDNEPLCASARSLHFGNDGKECWQQGLCAQAHNTWA
jgi:hypothetical protein